MFKFDAGKTGRVTLVAAALTLGLAGTSAFAQDTAAAPAAPATSHMHAKHASDPLMSAMFHLKTQLALNSSQQVQWDNAVAQMKSARTQGMALRKNAMAAYNAELAKDQPDLASVASVADSARAQGQQLRTSVRDAWLAVYANLSPSQKAMVRDALRDQQARMSEMRSMRHSAN